MAFTQEELLNLINNTIDKNTDHDPEEFSGGSVQTTFTKAGGLKHTLHLFFGYDKNKNSISHTMPIMAETRNTWSDAVLTKVTTEYARYNANAFGDMNELMKSSTTKKQVVGKGKGKGSRYGKDSTKAVLPQIITKSEFLEQWNDNAEICGLKKMRTMTDARYNKLKARIKHEPDFLEMLGEALQMASQSSFIQEGTWFTIDWVVANNENILKVLEGNYEDKKGSK